ncbi:hypothetical protein Tco_0762823 [Tanacetum coccineum]
MCYGSHKLNDNLISIPADEVLSLPADALHSAGLSSLLSPALRERHGLGQRWDTISEGIDAYFAKRYSDNKYNMKRDFWTAKGGAPAVDTIRHQPIGKRKFSFGSTLSACTEPLSMLTTSLGTRS